MTNLATNTQSASVGILTQALLDEISERLGVADSIIKKGIIEPFFWLAAHRLAKLAASFDQYVSKTNLCEAAQWVLPNFVRAVKKAGFVDIPKEGPLLVTSNHPGTFDSLVIAASLPRDDLKIVVSGLPFFCNLPSTAQHFIYTKRDNPFERMTVIRSAIRHLKDGGSLLIFPSGKVDPDPAVLPGADQAIERWSPSLEVMVRKVPQTRILVTIVSGVLSKSWVRNPLARLRKEIPDRQMIAEFLQVVQQMVFPRSLLMTPTVFFDHPITPSELGMTDDPMYLLGKLKDKVKNILNNRVIKQKEEW